MAFGFILIKGNLILRFLPFIYKDSYSNKVTFTGTRGYNLDISFWETQFICCAIWIGRQGAAPGTTGARQVSWVVRGFGDVVASHGLDLQGSLSQNCHVTSSYNPDLSVGPLPVPSASLACTRCLMESSQSGSFLQPSSFIISPWSFETLGVYGGRPCALPVLSPSSLPLCPHPKCQFSVEIHLQFLGRQFLSELMIYSMKGCVCIFFDKHKNNYFKF